MWFDPPDESGDEVLHVVSEHRAFRLKGYAFREFCDEVVPLLDGRHTLDEIQTLTAGVFRPEDVAESVALLAREGIVVEAGETTVPDDAEERMTPQLNLLRSLAPGDDLQGRLAASTVAVIGLGGAGPTVALALAAAGVGDLRLHDSLAVGASDTYFAPYLGVDAAGASRPKRVEALVRGAAPQVDVRASQDVLESEDDVRAAIDGADFVVCCLDAGQSNLILKLNRACLATGQRWAACAPAGAEIVVGPVVHPGRGPCYLCYRMRAVACAGNPEDAFAYERYLDRRKSDDSGGRQNLVFGVGVAANLIAWEVARELMGVGEPSLAGRILTIHLTDLRIERHTILRKPWCPACSPAAQREPEHAG